MEINVYAVKLNPPRWLRQLIVYIALPIGALLGATAAVRASVSLMTFTAGTPIKSQDVNAAFAALNAALPTVTEWKPYTPTATDGIIALTVMAYPGSAGSPAYWRRVGDSVEVIADTRFPTCASSTGTSISISLPPGLQIADASKLPGFYPMFGEVLGYNDGNSAVDIVGVAFAASGGSSSTGLGSSYVSADAGAKAISCQTLGGSSQVALKWHFTAPVKGWTINN